MMHVSWAGQNLMDQIKGKLLARFSVCLDLER
jgi:hypothetical protein